MKTIRLLFFIFFIVAAHTLAAQKDSSSKSITIHFLYGSRPAKGFRHVESKYFGGIHGGHVFMQLDTSIFSFMIASEDHVHIFPHRRNRQSHYVTETLAEFAKDTSGSKVTSITFQLTDSEYVRLKKVKEHYLSGTPYDYAFFGMRCAAAAYDVLSFTGIVQRHSRFYNVMINFYPKLMRKRMLKYAKRHQLRVERREGRKSRRWEKD